MTGLAALRLGLGGGESSQQEAGAGRRLARCVLRSCAGAFLSLESAGGGGRGGATAPPSAFRNVDAIYK